MDEHFFYSGSGGTTTIRQSTSRLRARHSHHGELSIRSGSGRTRLTIPGAAVLPFDETCTNTAPKQKRWSLTQLPSTAYTSPTPSSNGTTTASARRRSLQCILNRALSTSSTTGNNSTTTATVDQNHNDKVTVTEAARIAASIIKICDHEEKLQQEASMIHKRERGTENDETNDGPSTEAHFARSNNNDVTSYTNIAEDSGGQPKNDYNHSPGELQFENNSDDGEHFVQNNNGEQLPKNKNDVNVGEQHKRNSADIDQVQNNDDGDCEQKFGSNNAERFESSNAEQFENNSAEQFESRNAEQLKSNNTEQFKSNNAEQIIINDNTGNNVEQDSSSSALPVVSLSSPSRTFSSEASSIDDTRMINSDGNRKDNHDPPSSFISNLLVSADSSNSTNRDADDLHQQLQHQSFGSMNNISCEDYVNSVAAADYVSSLQNGHNDRFLMDVSLSSTLTARTHTSVDITSLCSNPQDDCDWGGAIALSQMHEAGPNEAYVAVEEHSSITNRTNRPTRVVAREMEVESSTAADEGQRGAGSSSISTSIGRPQQRTAAKPADISSHDIVDTSTYDYQKSDHDQKENSSITFSGTSSRDDTNIGSSSNPSTTKIMEEDYDTIVQMIAETPSIFFDDYQIAESTQQQLLPDFDCMHPQAFEPYALGAAMARESLEQLTMKQQQEEMLMMEGEQSSSPIMDDYLDWNNYHHDESHEDDPMGIESTLGSSTVARQRERARAAMRLYRRNKDIAENSRFRKYVNNLRYYLEASMKNQQQVSNKKAKNQQHNKNKWMIRHTMRNLLMSVMVVNGENDSHDNQGRGRDSVCLLGGVDILCQYISQWNDVKSLELAVPILGCLADRHPQRQAIIAAHCGVSHVLGCLRRHSSSLSSSSNSDHNHSKRSRFLLEEECIITLYKMTSHNIENVSQLVMNLGVSTVLEIMSQHQPNNIAIQKNTFGILLNVVKYDHSYVISQPNIFTMLVKSMERHKNSVALQHVAMILFRQLSCFAIHHVDELSFLSTKKGSAQASNKKNVPAAKVDSINDSMMDDMIRSNVVLAILSGMKRHPQHTSLIQHGFATLHILCESRLKARKQLIEGNITTNLGSLMRLIQRHEQNVWIQRDSFKLLRSLRDDVTSEGNNNANSSSLPQTLLKDSKMMSILSRAGLHGKLYGT